MTEVTCAVIVDVEGHVFAAQRSEVMSLPLKWEFPGGKIEPNETPKNCLLREIKEELNIEVQIIQELPRHIHHYPNFTIQLIPFICYRLSGGIILKEHSQFKWLHPNELLALDWAEADLPIVKSYLNLINVNR